jgi:hypothetical protein
VSGADLRLIDEPPVRLMAGSSEAAAVHASADLGVLTFVVLADDSDVDLLDARQR